MKFTRLLLTAAVAMAMTSCSSDEPTEKFTVEYPASGNFIYSLDTATGSSTVSEGCYVKLEFMTDYKVNIKVTNMLYNGTDRISFELENQTWSINYSTGAREVNVASVSALGSQGAYRPVPVKNLKIVNLDRAIDGNYQPSLSMTMTVDDTYDVRIVPTTLFDFGTSEVVTRQTAATYTTDDTYYAVALDRSKMTADIVIFNAKFATNMPTQTQITIPGVPFTIDQDGYSFAAAEVIPNQYNGSPKPEFVITDISGTGQVGGSLKLKFTVAGTWDVTATLSELGL